MAGLSPMMQQYLQIKEENPGTIVFFRLGDFYEMFFEDAKLVSKELDLTLTGRDCGLEERAPMCGVPHHSSETYIARLIEKGYKVAICEQVEDPALSKGLVRREIVRIVTPGTVTESAMLEDGASNYLASIFKYHDSCAICFVDTSTGQLLLTTLGKDRVNEALICELGRFMPREVILNQAAADSLIISFIQKKLGCCFGIMDENLFDPHAYTNLVTEHFKVKKPEDLKIDPNSAALFSVAAALDYLFDTQMTGLENINKIEIYSDKEFMQIDLSARRNLDLFANTRSGNTRGSLFWVLNRTSTSMGKRMLTNWLERPLLQPAEINRRLHGVTELYNDGAFVAQLDETLSCITDLERLMTRIVYHSASPKDMLDLGIGASALPKLRSMIAHCECDILKTIYHDIDELQDVSQLILSAIDEKPPKNLKDGGVILKGFDEELDRVREDGVNGRHLIEEMETLEKERTGIKNLKIKYNKVFGYYIEVTNSFKHLTPDHYIRKQTTVNSERYITEELKSLEGRVLGANDRAIAMEHEIFNRIRETLGKSLYRVQRTAAAIATLDVLRSLAEVALDRNYCCPTIATDGRLVIQEGRHPVVETISDVPFVPNDCNLDEESNRCAIITGPNMAGKSTFMRQNALITIMAQIGSYVPAKTAHVGIVDAVYTRVGASDDLFMGQSTFMVEMSEVANILKNATKHSLLILDEIGRGTSTYDGMAIARAVLEYIVSRKLGAKAMFATHYHELTALSQTMEGVNNFNVAVKKRGESITFLRRIIPGAADRSYGIEVAALAGVPKELVSRAREILKDLEFNQPGVPVSVDDPVEHSVQLTFGSMPDNPVVQRLKQVDMDTFTPIEALNLLYELSDLAKQ
ncbi:MAG: DNA mismatch repair protein MutS, partial [Clostridia bacterium]|nr:DNA mismatch repair protein MutS [Clostridia bacterium]